ncbi:hypothetical protein [Myxococcus sp. CA040A]|uniref:hypothetical protein n=1 Tax=Myxococcus sp. CA040A TaxID=2741738 RepID=UPI00157A71BA|nr:hypothetical protein [Myxococcus sp. CA040A]NTX00186.1 hypothetical protein [Myxococcus sp. CA040A]
MPTLEGMEPLGPVCEVLRKAFPEGVPDSFYLPLLKVLAEEMSFMSVARALEMAWGYDYVRVLHDAYGAELQVETRVEEVAAVRRLLGLAGYDEQ